MFNHRFVIENVLIYYHKWNGDYWMFVSHHFVLLKVYFPGFKSSIGLEMVWCWMGLILIRSCAGRSAITPWQGCVTPWWGGRVIKWVWPRVGHDVTRRCHAVTTLPSGLVWSLSRRDTKVSRRDYLVEWLIWGLSRRDTKVSHRDGFNFCVLSLFDF